MGWEMARANRAAGTAPDEGAKWPANEAQERPEAENPLAQEEPASIPAPQSASSANVYSPMQTEACDDGPRKSEKPQKEEKKHGCLFKLVMTVVVLFALLIGIARVNSCQRENTTYTWPTSGLATLLPQPESNYGEVRTNSDDSLWIKVHKTEADAYDSYTEACKDKGFTEDATSFSSSYAAYDSNGNRLRLSYNSSLSHMDIDLDAADEMSEIDWPTLGVATSIPTPTSLIGSISTNKSNSFSVELAMDKDAFSAYVDACVAAGYTVDFSKSDKRYEASNAEGVRIEVSYQGGGVTRISAEVVSSAS